ncbi:hypothetical protein Btru_075500 [Bulinus truncatus]|nr:hypothetical protein Btru_075500 [Bulinus truncatus]
MFSLLKEREHCGKNPRLLYNVTAASEYFLQRLKLEKKLKVHDGCVNTICWNDAGSLILSGSDDQHLAITDPFSGKNVVKFRSGHRSNIFSAKFLPGSVDREIVSCSGSGEIFYTDVDREDTYGTNRFDCHFGTTYKLLVVPNEAATFLSCGDDGTVRFFDLRTKTSCSKFNCEEDIVIHLRNAITAMAVDPLIPFHLAVASSDGIVRLYDRRMLKTKETGANTDSLICRFPPPMTTREKRHYRITSLNYRPGSHDVLVNYSSENIYLFNTYELNKLQCFSSKLDPKAGCSKDSKAGLKESNGAGTSAAVDNGSDNDSAFKPIKRLRLRGDWSDTGPDARPESEEPALTNTIMQRMSDLLTRMLNSRNERSENQEGNEEGAAANDLSEDVVTEDSVEMDTADPYVTDTEVHVFHSVVITSSSVSDQETGRHPSTPHSISSEGLMSPELSSQELESHSENMFTAKEDLSVAGVSSNKVMHTGCRTSNADSSQLFLEEGLSNHSSSHTLVAGKDSNSDQTCLAGKISCDSSEKLIAENTDTSEVEASAISHEESFDSAPNYSDMVDSNVVSKFPKSTGEKRHNQQACCSNVLPGAINQYTQPQSCCIEVSHHSETQPEVDLGHACADSSIDINSESNDSISDQMSANLHIVQGQTSDALTLPVTGSRTTTEDSSSELVPSSSLSTPPASVLYHPETSSAHTHVLNANPCSLRNKRKETRTWTSNTVVSPTAGGAITPRKTSSENSVLSYSPSVSDSPVAIADRDLSGYEGNLSQQTLNDVSAFSSLLSLTGSLGTSITEVTPTTGQNDSDMTQNQPVTRAANLHFTALTKDLNETDSVQHTESKTCFGVAEGQTCPATNGSQLIWDSTAKAKTFAPTSTGVSPESDQGFVTNPPESSVCVFCGNNIVFKPESLDSSTVKYHPFSNSCYHCYLTNQASPSIITSSKTENVQIKIEPYTGQSNLSSMQEENHKNDSFANLTLESPEQFNSPVTDEKISKGKGKGKSSLKAKKTSNRAEKFAPYNSGKMKISPISSDIAHSFSSLPGTSSKTLPTSTPNSSPDSNLVSVISSEQFPSQYEIQESTGTAISKQSEANYPMNPDEDVDAATEDDGQSCPPRALYRLPSLKSCPQGFERQRRVGYSLPPTGSFQLHSDDDDDDGSDVDDDEEHSRIKSRLKSDKEDISKAAKKIQELYRKKREAKEMARMMDVPQPRTLMKYSGHRNCRTMIKEANFYGDKYVVSGSDCGRILAWERETGQMVMYLDADRHVVNCVQPNLHIPVIASSGIDYDIKIWSPLEEDSQFELDKAEMIIRRNELMLKETRDTVTVPAAFMLRILASLSQIRTGRNSVRGAQVSDS